MGVPFRISGGIVIAYAIGYALAGFTTFITILGRYGNKQTCDEGNGKQAIDCCCSVLEQDSTQQFVPNLKITVSNFASGFRRLFCIRKQTGRLNSAKNFKDNLIGHRG